MNNMKKVLGISLVIMLVATFVVPMQTLAYSVVQDALAASGVYSYSQAYSNYPQNYPVNYQNNYQNNYQGNYQNNYPSNGYYGYGQGNLIYPQYQNTLPSVAYYGIAIHYQYQSGNCNHANGFYSNSCGGYYGY